MLLLGDSNDPQRDLYTVGKGTFLDELLTVAGRENVLSSNMAKCPKISKEFIISKSPEIIIEVDPMSGRVYFHWIQILTLAKIQLKSMQTKRKLIKSCENHLVQTLENVKD